MAPFWMNNGETIIDMKMPFHRWAQRNSRSLSMSTHRSTLAKLLHWWWEVNAMKLQTKKGIAVD
jgi:hypothetical protein